MFIHEIRQTLILVIISIIFANGHYNHVLHIGIHDINALGIRKAFLSTIFLLIIFIRETWQTWIFVIISIPLNMGTTIMFSSLGYTILMLWICKKGFSFHHFPCNQSSSMKWDKHGYS